MRWLRAGLEREQFPRILPDNFPRAVPHTLFPTPFGTCGIAWNDQGLTGVQFPEDPPEHTEQRLVARTGSEGPDEPPPWVRESIADIQAILAGTARTPARPRLDWSRVGEFQRKVYEAAMRIPPGETRTYGEIAREVGLGPAGARAVGHAMGTNPWVLLMPCHRVVGANGKLVGFSASGGKHTKSRLLAIEQGDFFA